MTFLILAIKFHLNEEKFKNKTLFLNDIS